jgi:nucleotide sugar dehydrogenase
MNVTFVGIGRLGLCSALVFERNGFNVVGVDVNQSYINSLNNKSFTSHEPNVTSYLQTSKNFRATTNLEEGISHSDTIFIVVPTPNGGGDDFYDHSILSYTLSEIRKLNPINKDIIVCCTVMPGYLKSQNIEKCTINYNPEFIAQGSIIKDFEHPDFVLIGHETLESGKRIKDMYERIYKGNTSYAMVGVLDAEITKISINGFVTTKIAYANMIAELCDTMGADKHKVLKSASMDSRIGSKYFKPGYSFGGPCFPRDTKALSIVLKKHNISPEIIDATRKQNDIHNQFMAQLIIDTGVKEYTFENICYKENSSVPIIEESPKLKIASILVENNIDVTIIDEPHMIELVKQEYDNKFKCISRTHYGEQTKCTPME